MEDQTNIGGVIPEGQSIPEPSSDLGITLSSLETPQFEPPSQPEQTQEQEASPAIDFGIDRGRRVDQIVDASETSKYIGYTPYFADLANRDAQAARAQSGIEKLGAGLYQGVVGEIIGGTAQGLGAFGMLAGSEKNALYNFGEALRDITGEAHIFEREPGQAFAFSDVGWWAKNMPSMLSTLSMMIPGAAVGKGASLVGRGLSTMGRAGRVAKQVGKARRSAKVAGEVFDEAAALAAAKAAEASRIASMERYAQTIGTGFGMRHAENIREAVDVATRAEQDFIDSNMTLDEMMGTEAWRSYVANNGGHAPYNKTDLAKYVGAAAAKRSYAVNSSNLVFDLAQSAMIFKPFKAVTRGATARATTKEIEEAASKLGKKVVEDASKRNAIQRLGERFAPAATYVGGMASEGAEEAINFIGSEEGLAYAQELRGMETGTFDERLNEYINDSHLWESAFFGAIGGGIFQAFGQSYGKKQNALLEAYLERENLTKGYAKALSEATTEEEVLAIKNSFIHNLGLTAAQQGRVDQLVAQLQSDEYLAELAQEGFGSIEELEAKRDQMIEQVLAAEEGYKEAITWAQQRGLSGMALGSYLQDTMGTNARLYAVGKRLEETQGAPALSDNEQYAVKKGLLDMLKKEHANNRAYKPVIEQLEQEVAAAEEAGLDSKVSAEDLNTDAIDNLTLGYLQQGLKNEQGLQRSDRAVGEYMKRGDRLAKRKFKELKQKQREQVSQENDQQKLQDIIAAAKKNKDEDLERVAQDRLDQLQAEAKAEDDTDKDIQDGATVSDATDDGQLSLFGDEEGGTQEESPVPEVEPTEVSDEEFKQFVDTGVVTPERIKQLATKIQQGEQLTEREQAMRTEAAEEIEQLLNEAQDQGRTVAPIEERLAALTSEADKAALIEALQEEKKELARRKRNLRAKAKRRLEKGLEEEAADLLQQADVLVQQLAEVNDDIKQAKEYEVPEQQEEQQEEDPMDPMDARDADEAESAFEEERDSLYRDLAPSTNFLELYVKKEFLPGGYGNTPLDKAVADQDLSNVMTDDLFYKPALEALNKLAKMSDAELLNLTGKQLKEMLSAAGLRSTAKSNNDLSRLVRAVKDGYMTMDDVRSVLNNTVKHVEALQAAQQNAKDSVNDVVIETPTREVQLQLDSNLQLNLARALNIGIAHTPGNNDPFYEWQLLSDNTSVTLNTGDADTYKALMAVSQGRGNVIIRPIRRQFKNRNQGVVDLGRTNPNVLRRNTTLKRLGILKGTKADASELQEKPYQIVARIGSEEVVIGWVPEVKTILSQAAELQADFEGGRRLESIPANEYGRVKISGVNSHPNALQALQTADKVLALREYLDRVPGGVDVTAVVKRNLALDGKAAVGSLLRPGPFATATIASDPNIMSAIEEHGIGVLMRDSEGQPFLYDPVRKQRIDGLPYQDGVRLEDARKGNVSVGYGWGYVFIPVVDPTSRRVMWVRVNDRPTLGAMGAGKDRSVVGVLARQIKPHMDKGNTNGIVAGLSQFIPVIDNRGPQADQVISPTYSGAVVNASGQIVFYDNGKVAAQIRKDGSATENVYRVLGRMPFMMEVKGSDRGTINLEEDLGGRTLIDGFLEAAKLPVGSVKDQDGNVLGYTHTLGPVRRPTGDQRSSFFPDTQQTAMPIRIEGFAPEGVNVVEPDVTEENPAEEGANMGEDLFGGMFLTVDRAAASPLDKQATPGEQKEAEEWMAKNLPHVPFRRVKGLIRRGGKEGYGIWHNGMVTVSDIAVAGTEYHEAFHAVMDAYLTPERKAKILAEAKKKYGNLNEIELEEKLAEAFREYMLTNGKSMQEKSAIRRFFSELLELVRAMFTGEYQARQLMHSINNGTYAYKPDARTQEFQTKWKQTPTLSAEEMSELESSIPFVLNNVIKKFVHSTTGMSPQEAEAALSKTPLKKYPELIKDIIALNADVQAAVRSEEDGASEVDKEALQSVSQRVLDMTFRKDGLMKAFIQQMNGDIPASTLERLDNNADQLIETFGRDKNLQRDIYGVLAVDTSTGTTQNEQYNTKMSMAEINPMDKVPAQVKAFISSKPYLSSSVIAAIHQSMRDGIVNTGQQLAEMVAEEASKGTESIDTLSTFGLPRRMNFREVYPFLLYHLHDSVSPEAMLDKMLVLARSNPNIALLANDLKKPENENLLTQFYVGMKRAKTNEINVIEQRDAENPLAPGKMVAVRSGVISPENALKMRYADGVLSKIRIIRSDAGNLQSLKDFAADPNKHNAQDLRKMMQAMGFPNNEGIKMWTTGLSTTQVAQVMSQLVSMAQQKNTQAQDRHLTSFIYNNKLALADMTSVQPRYRNHKGKYVYAFMNPSYATEELDRLMSPEHLAQRVHEDPRLKNSDWQRQGPKLHYKRFGGFMGTPYSKMTELQRIQYDIAVLEAGYVPIPTPSDADNSLLVATSWMGSTLVTDPNATEEQVKEKLEQHRESLLKSIWQSESSSTDARGSIPGLKEARTWTDAKSILEAWQNKEVEILIDKLKDSKVYYTREQLKNYVAATYVSHWNTAHWLGGNFNEFQKTDKNGKDVTVVNFQKRFKHILSPGQTSADTGTFNVVTVAEPIKKVKFGKLGEVKIDRADGQSYVTLDHYRRILKAHGEWNPHVERVIQKAEKGEALSRDEAYLLKPYKPFYYGRVGNKGHQIKNSVVPLLPNSKDPELRKMLDWMQSTKDENGRPIDQVNMESAHKVGLGDGQLVTMWNEDNEFVTPEEFTTDQINSLPMQHHRNQVHITEHMSHNDTVTFGSQASKLITSNLRQYTKGFTHQGKAVTGEDMIKNLVNKEAEMLKHKLDEMKRAVFTKDGQVDQTKIRKWIADNLGETVPDAVREAVESGKPINHALIEGPIVQAIKSSFQKEFKKMRVAGGMQVQISDLGRSGVDGSLRGMRVEDGKVLPAEIKTSRKFLPKKYRNMSIDQIKAADPEALQMIVYRVPAEGKNSMAVVEVVEFLPDGQDGMVVPAEFVHQMGSDFDIDKLFVNWKFTPGKSGKLSPYKQAANEYHDLMRTVLLNPEVVQNEVLVPQGFDSIKAFRDKVKKRNTSRNLSTGETIDDYLANNPYSVLTHLQLTSDNIAGIGLKGIAALNNVFWINMQRDGLKLQFRGNTFDFAKISREMLIWNAESVAASMDGAKDPVFGEMGIGVDNFQIFQDLAMLNHLAGSKPEDAAMAAWEIVSDPYVKDLMSGKLKEKDLTTLSEEGTLSARNQRNIQNYREYKRNIAPVLEEARTATRFQENRLQDMDNTMLQTLTQSRTEKDGDGAEIVDAEGVPVDVVNMAVNQANADIVIATDQVLKALGVGFYENNLAAFFGLDYAQYNKASSKISAEIWLGNKLTKDGGPLGIRKATEERKALDPNLPEEWSLQNFLEFFTLPAGRELLAQNPDLQYVVERLYPRSERPYKVTRNGEAYVFDKINVTNLDDASLLKDFKGAWTRLMEDTSEEMQYEGVNIANALGRSLIDYEAGRSGFSFGVQYLTSALPDGVITSLETPESRISFVGVRAFNFVTQPNAVEMVSGETPQVAERKAAQSRKPLRTAERVFFSMNYEGENVRTFVTLDPRSAGSVGLRTIKDLEEEAVRNIPRAKTLAEPPNKKKKSKVRYGTAEGGQTTQEKVNLLKSKFAANGVNVEVEFDATMDEAGDVEFDGRTGVIRLHPNKLGADTVIHEFGHIYIEMLGYNDPMVQAAIEQLKDTELYAEVKALYPELSSKELDMEVLATAIGREGAGIFAEAKQESKFMTLLNRIFRAIGKMFGREPNFAKQLAKDMLSTNKSLQARQVKFRAQQRLAKNLAVTDLAIAVADEVAERVDHMRRLGATTEQQKEMLDRWSTSAFLLRTEAEMKEVSLQRLTQEIDDTLKDINDLMRNVDGYLEKVATQPEFTQSDVDFFNTAYQMLQMATTFSQAVKSLNADADPGLGRDTVAAFKSQDARLNTALTELDRKVSEAVSNKMKAQNFGDEDLAAIETNIFHLAGTDLAKMVTDSSVMAGGTLGMKEQQNIILQLTDKLIKRVIQANEMESKQAISKMGAALDKAEAAGVDLQDLIDETGKAFISPVSDSYWVARSKAADVRMWDADNTEQEYTSEYYKGWKYAPKQEDIDRLENLVARLEESKRNKTLTEEDEILLADTLEDLDNMRVAKGNFLKFHEPMFDMEAYNTDRDNARRESAEALAEFDQAFTHPNGNPKFKTKYHTGFKVRDRYVNKNFTGTVRPKAKWENKKYAALSDAHKTALGEINEIMQDAYGKEHEFFGQRLLPQVPVGEKKTVKERIKEITALEPSQSVIERQDSVGNRVFVRSDLKMMKRADGEIDTDIRKTLPEFLKQAYAAKAANQIETFALSTRDQLAQAELVSAKRGRSLFRKEGKSTQGELRIKGAQSESMKVLEHQLQGLLGQGWTDKVEYDGLLKNFLAYNSFMGIGLNFSAWANNWWYGSTQQWLETWGGGNMWSREDMRRARKTVGAHLVELVRTRNGRKVSTNKTVGLLNFFDVTMDQRELPVGGAELSAKLNDMAYIGQTLGEIGMQSQIALSMMYNQMVKLPNGQEVALMDALEYNTETGEVTWPDGAKMIKADGQEIEITLQELGAFKEKVVSVLQKIHGAYNKEDIGRFHRHWVGQLVFQFRKWVPLAMKRRFGRDEYNQAREQKEIGWYTALWRDVVWKSIAGESGKRFRFYGQYKAYENQPHVQAAIRKAAAEHIATLVVAGMATLASSLIELDGDDDDEFFLTSDDFYKAKLLYHLDRLHLELAQYTPTGAVDFFTKFGSDPAAGVRTAKNLFKFAQQLGYGLSPFHEIETFQGGAHYGENKLGSYGLRLLPGVKQYKALQDAAHSYQVYRLA